MTDNTKTFTLVGKFDDKITPALKQINAEIKTLTAAFTKLNDNLKPVSKNMALMAESSSKIAGNFRLQTNNVDKSIKSLSNYRSEIERVISANALLARSTPSGYGGGHGGVAGGHGGGGKHGGGINMHELIGAELITEGIIKGFEKGAEIIENVFDKFKEAFHERMESQIEDIASAGGLFSALQAERAKGKPISGFGDTIDDAMNYQRKINQDMAVLAAQLPGATIDYTNNARKLTDFMINIQAEDPKKFMNAMNAVTGATAKTNPEALESGIKEVAKATTLMDQLAGGGGGAISMTMVAEHIATQQKVNVTSMQQKYAMLQKNTTFVAAMKRHQDELNKTTAGTAERVAVMVKIMKEAIPAEQINLLQRSMNGFVEGVRSAFLDPNTGMLGLSRMLGFQMKQFDSMTGEVIREADGSIRTMEANLMQVIEDIIGNVGPIISNLLPAMVDAFSPFEGLTRSLIEFREWSYMIFHKFQAYTTYYEELAKGMPDFKGDPQASMRGGLAILTNIFKGMGEMDDDKYHGVMEQLRDFKNKDALGNVGKIILDTFLSSKFLDRLEEIIGAVAGSIVKGIGDALTAIANGSDKIAKSGFMKGFSEAGGVKGFTEIISSLFKLLWNAIKLVIQTYIGQIFESIKNKDLSSFVGLIGIGTLILLPFQGLISSVLKKLLEVRVMLNAARFGVEAEKLPFFATPASMGVAKGARGALGRAASLAFSFMPGAGALGGAARGLGGLARGVGRVARFIPGEALAFGAIDAGMRIAAGENAGTAIGKAASATIGTSLGALLGQVLIPVPGLGAAIGGIAGGIVGDKVGEALFAPVDAMVLAAKAQEKAAKVMEDANKGAASKYFKYKSLGGVEAINRKFGGGVGLSKALKDPAKLKEMGLTSPADVAKAKQIANDLTLLNNATAKTHAAQTAYSASVKNNTKDQDKNRAALIAAQTQQKAIEEKMKKTWESTNLTAQQGLLHSAGALADALNTAANHITKNLGNGQTSPGGARPGLAPTTGGGGAVGGHGPQPPIRWAGSPGLGMGLGRAIKEEMAHKPPGSEIVIANSSETIIPAFSGLNLGGLAAGLNRFTDGANALSALADLSSGGGAISGNLIEVGKMLLARGLQVGMNSFFQYGIGFLPGGGGYIGKHSPHSLHYANRALDVVGTNAQLDAAYAALRGSNPTELLWQVPGHYDHLHVAYARGLGNPTYFPTQSDAMMWESKMMPPGAQVRSVTSNTSENLGGTTTVNAPITINQQPGQDAEQLASIVALRLSEAIMQANSSMIQYS